jgi:hypothetical protein
MLDASALCSVRQAGGVGSVTQNDKTRLSGYGVRHADANNLAALVQQAFDAGTKILFSHSLLEVWIIAAVLFPNHARAIEQYQLRHHHTPALGALQILCDGKAICKADRKRGPNLLNEKRHVRGLVNRCRESPKALMAIVALQPRENSGTFLTVWTAGEDKE